MPKEFETSIVVIRPVRLESAIPTITTAAERAMRLFEVFLVSLTESDYSRE